MSGLVNGMTTGHMFVQSTLSGCICMCVCVCAYLGGGSA